MDNEFLLMDRIQKIQQVIGKYGEDNFYISFSGGKDSCVMSALFDEALPGNKIPRVYANTGIELNMMVDFVKRERERDERIQIIKPSVPIRQMLEEEGYPFKSKFHSRKVDTFQRNGMNRTVKVYLKLEPAKSGNYVLGDHACPKVLREQFEEGYALRISNKCCDRLKKDPLHKWQKENNRPYAVIGIRPSEGGKRENAQCMAFHGDKLHAFQPLVPVSDEWERWYIESHNVRICDIYKPPYNFPRTGCKGCPYAIKIQEELDTLERYFPNERKQCEIIWKPVYDEYRRLKYRLRDGGRQMNIFDYIEEE